MKNGLYWIKRKGSDIPEIGKLEDGLWLFIGDELPTDDTNIAQYLQRIPNYGEKQ